MGSNRHNIKAEAIVEAKGEVEPWAGAKVRAEVEREAKVLEVWAEVKAILAEENIERGYGRFGPLVCSQVSREVIPLRMAYLVSSATL